MSESWRASGMPQQITRRKLLKTGGLLGAAAAIPGLPGCGWLSPDDDGEPLGHATRETRTLHFDFSRVCLHQLWLSAPLSQHHQALLQVHDDASRARLRAQNAAMANVPDSQLTHYIANVDLPANNLQHLRVFGKRTISGEDVLAATFIHVPRVSLDRLTQRRAAQGQTVKRSAKMKAYGITLVQDQALSQVSDFVTPFDTAVSLIFHDPDIMSLDPDLGAEIIDIIENAPCDPNDDTCNPDMSSLAQAIDLEWPASTGGGWATLTQATDQNGVPQYDSQGNPIYNYTLAASTLAALQMVLPPIKQTIFADPTFGPSATNPAGANYHPQTSTTSVDVTPTSSLSVQGALSDSSQFEIVPADGVGSSHHGLKYVQIEATDPTNKTVTVTIKNAYLRFVAAYAQCYDAAGNTLAPPQPDPHILNDPNQYNSSRGYWLGLMSSNDAILGVPLLGNDVASTTFTFNVPQVESRRGAVV